MEIYIVTGYSGAGKTVALKTLEDAGFFCVDNLPVELFSSYIQSFARKPAGEKLALGIDIRSGKNLDDIINQVQILKNKKIIFLAATKTTLIRRFQETRRNHPLAKASSLSHAIEHEMKILNRLKKIANTVIETDNLNLHDLQNIIRNLIEKKEKQKMLVTLMSFGFKYGIPKESNFLYDVRSLPNPYFEKELSELDGRDKKIQEYLFSKPTVTEYYKELTEFLTFALKKAFDSGFLFATVSIGCTGGKHRSVAFVEKLFKEDNKFCTFIVKHRDIKKEEK
jgi:RNase adapter protein RapZ